MVKLGYGKAYFPDMIERELLYIDRTRFLEKMEDVGSDAVFMLRPRRFGKSLWVSMSRHYYGIQYKDRFERLFGKLYIGKHPTPNANRFLILSFDFSGIDAEMKDTAYRDFLMTVQSGVTTFFTDYKSIFDKASAKEVLAAQSPQEMMTRLFTLVNQAAPDQRIYLLIDEYDHFANQLMAYQMQDFKEVVSKGGFVRVFYETLKKAMGEGTIGKMFITGVSPITLDSLTSGFNIASNLSLDPELHDMFGFTNDEVVQILRAIDMPVTEIPEYNALLKDWYDGYRFAVNANHEIYNPDMVLYFAEYYRRNRMMPDKMLDTNIASSYSRIRAMFRLPNRKDGEFENLHELLESREVSVDMTQIFNFDLGFSTNDFLTLLFYMGFLTFKSKAGDRRILRMPNRVIEHLYHKYFAQLLSERTHFARGIDSLEFALGDLIMHNNPTKLADLMTHTLSNLSGRDATVPFVIREKNVQVLLFSFLSFSQSYLVESEYNAQNQYFDILATSIKQMNMPHNFLFELKYLPKAGAKKVKEEYAKAEVQIAAYLQTPKAQQVPNLRAWIMIVVGTEVKICKQVV
jgi:hypothetical protein